MFSLRRVMAVGVVLAVAAIITCSHVWGQAQRSKERKDLLDANKIHQPDSSEPLFSTAFARSRFADELPVVYENTKGETLFGWQFKPVLPNDPPRPRDYLVMVDTSASKANGYLAAATKLADALVLKLGADDRLSLWTVSVATHDLSKGFKVKAELSDAVKLLNKEYPSGAVNLRKGLADAVASFPGGDSRQRVLLYLGDGNSAAGPLDGDSRAALAENMVKRGIAFYAVPIGRRHDPANLHGLVGATGGKVVRVEAQDTPEQTIDHVIAAAAVPILYPSAFQLPAEVTEFVPTKLPPLRADAPTLIVGKMARPIGKLACRISGTVAGIEVNIPVSQKLPQAEVENFFLSNVLGQWREHKDRPALLQADRTLAFAYDQNQMARSKLIADGDVALEQDKLEHAFRLYEQALKVDPHSGEAKAGVNLVRDLRDGKVTRKQLEESMEPKDGDDLQRISPKGKLVVSRAKMLFGQADDAAKQTAQPPRPPEGEIPPIRQDQLKEAEARIKVADQLAATVVNDVIRSANQQVRTEPDAAHELLKRTLDGVLTNPDLSPRAQINLAEQLRRSLESIDRTGAVVKRDRAGGAQLHALADARVSHDKIVLATQNLTRERIRAFDQLMRDAREEFAFIYARDMQQDMLDTGQPIPRTLIVGYNQSQTAKHLKELSRLRRIREEKWLDVFLEVERSHVPFPDEPPIIYPSPSQIRKITRKADGSSQFDNWADWSKYRIDKYAASTLGESMPARGLFLRDQLGKPVSFKQGDWPNDQYALGDILDWMATNFDLTFDIYERPCQDEGLRAPRDTMIASKEFATLQNVTLATVLKKLLSKVPLAPSEATYIIRRDTIEITTTKLAANEKCVRVYPVADLLVYFQGTTGGTIFGVQGGTAGIQSGLQFQGGLPGVPGLQFQGGLPGLQFQGGVPGLQFQGGVPGLQFQGGVPGLQFQGGVPGLQFQGGVPGLQFPGGVPGLQFPGGIPGVQFQGGFQGVQFQGGIQGFQGIQIQGGIGQIPGFQGQQSGAVSQAYQGQLLVSLIKQLVGRQDEWQTTVIDPQTRQRIPGVLGADGQPRPLFPGEDVNNASYFAPAQAIIVKGSSRITSRSRPPYPVQPGAVGGNMLGMNVKNDSGRAVVIEPKKDPAVRVLGHRDKRPDDVANKKPSLDAKVIWQDALAKGVDDPGIIIAVADFLGQMGAWEHVAESLKADLRQGVLVKPWVYESLAIALRNSGGSAEEIERAELSAVDLQPTDAQGFLKAAQAMADLKRYDRAVAFCRQASLLEPNTPYAYNEALNYANATDDLEAMQWASGNLLKRDWPVHNNDIQLKAKQKLEEVSKKLEDRNRAQDSKKLRAAVQEVRRRDLVIKLSWQGQADLDLRVTEPTGSICWALNRLTVGGGTLVGDTLADMNNEAYMAAEAFAGEYTITIDRVWGRPLSDKAQLRVIRHQGTMDETEELFTVDGVSDAAKPIKIKLDGGRRTEAAYVPPPSARQSPDAPEVSQSSHDKILYQLRDMADPENFIFTQNRGFRSDCGSSGAMVSAPVSRPVGEMPKTSAYDRVLYQTKVSSFVSNSLEVTAQALISADRRSMRLSVTPVFAPLSANAPDPKVVSSVIP